MKNPRPITRDQELAAFGDENAALVHVGGVCPRGSGWGHLWHYGEEDADGACGSKSWQLYVAFDPEDVRRLPDWIRERVEFESHAFTTEGI